MPLASCPEAGQSQLATAADDANLQIPLASTAQEPFPTSNPILSGLERVGIESAGTDNFDTNSSDGDFYLEKKAT